MAPPFTFSRVSSMSNSRWNFSTTAANASLISKRSMFRFVMPAFLTAIWAAGAGAVSMITGSAPAVAVITTRPRGFRPCAFA